MATKWSLERLSSLLLFFSVIVAVQGRGHRRSKLFDVTKYGAVGNARIDCTKAFGNAWTDACAYNGRGKFLVPKGKYLLGPIDFIGPCNGPLAFLIKGTLEAPTDPRTLFMDAWIRFQYLNDLTVKGGGFLDGQGSSAWPYNDCLVNPNCKTLPTTLRSDMVENSTIQNLHSLNPKNTHINVFGCKNLNLTRLHLIAPATSPNTDGIHIGTSVNIQISNSTISTGDDCIAMVSGSEGISIHGVTCGPGHGISIGSLGRSHGPEFVTGISVKNCTLVETDNGVRIKTWAPSQYGLASGILFQDILMNNASNPIVVDQSYCPLPNCDGGDSGVQIQNVTFDNIFGISNTKVAADIQCSGLRPCKNVELRNINLSYLRAGVKAKAQCSHVFGSSYGTVNPAGCV